MNWKDKDTISFDWCVEDVKQQLKDNTGFVQDV